MKNDFREFYDVEYIMHGMTDEELYHFGVKGQKWGKRRYQNEDGTLTPAGIQHYGRTLGRYEHEYKSNMQEANMYGNRIKSLEEKRKHNPSKDAKYLKKIGKLEKKRGKYSDKANEYRTGSNDIIKGLKGNAKVKNVKIQENPDKIATNSVYNKRTYVSQVLAGIPGQAINAGRYFKNKKYYNDPTNMGTAVNGSDVFITLQDGRVVPVSFGMKNRRKQKSIKI